MVMGRRAFGFNIVIAATTADYNLATALGALGYVAGPVAGTVTINAGVVVGSSGTGGYAFDVGSLPAAGSSISIINNGEIQGAGGAGGNGGSGNTGANGGTGGPALNSSIPITVTNNGAIRAGGAGGAGGGGVLASGQSIGSGGGGGGGQGYGNSSGGTHGAVVASFPSENPAFDANGTLSINGTGGTSAGAGAGGAGGICRTIDPKTLLELSRNTGGAGGAGGAWGAAGSAGVAATNTGGIIFTGQALQGGGAGGAGGVAVQGNSNVTFLVAGTINGSQVG